jgi:hypothetical protein
MTERADLPMNFGRDLQLLTRDLTRISGTFEEVATVWRRAHHGRPGLPLRLPLRLQAATCELAQTVTNLAQAGPGHRSHLASLMTRQISALEKDTATAEAMTRGLGTLPVGDAGLWKSLTTAMRQARARALSLVLQLPEITPFADSGPTGGRRIA